MNRVEFEGCLCPGAPHPSDWLDLYPETTIEIGAAANLSIARHGNDEMALQVALTKAFVRYGIRGWNRVDDKGNEVAVNHDDPLWVVSLDAWLPWSRAFSVADAASMLYSGAVFDPLVKRLAARSQRGQTESSTSPNPDSGPSHQTPSGSSSPESSVDGEPSADPTP